MTKTPEAGLGADWIEQVRRRPGMYVGSTSSRGIGELVREVLSNSIDLALVGAVTELRVRVEGDGGFTVVDDGPGIDVTPGADGVPFLTRVLTTWRDTPTADGHQPHVHLAVGLGLHVVCALSDRLEISTRRDGQTWRQRFAAGRAVGDLERIDSELVAGTSVAFRPDPAIFESPRRVDLGALDQLMEDLAALVPGLTTRFDVQDHVRPPAAPAALLRPAGWPGRSWQLRADDGQDALVIAFTTGSSSHPADGRWLLNLRDLTESEGLIRTLDEALDQAVDQAQRHGVTVVASAMMLSPEYSGPTKGRCDDPRLEQLIRRAVTDNLPAMLAADPLLRAALLGE